MNETQCNDAEASVRDTLFNIVRVFHIIFGTIIVVMVFRNVWSYNTKSLKFHTNLIILISNILIIYLLLTLSYIVEAFNNFLILFTYSNPCDCLIQVWLVYLIRIPDYLYILGSPLFHFVLMTERVLATIFVKIYDKQGKMFGVTATIILWSLNFLFALYVYLSSSLNFDQPLAYITLTNVSNSFYLINIHYFIFILIISIAIGDYLVIKRNRKIKSNL
uniref:Uncharacterized protein n=1 Tax=Meloidogyne enterolobii TaxID=390850 RepID=A0A6V7WZZ9_MELEN|nr:unnamed protein product [Meloidogyne enterolobii]